MNELELKRHIADKKTLTSVYESVQNIINTGNTMGNEDLIAQGIFEGLINSHKTLQQCFMKSFIMAMKQYHDADYYDARNEASVKLAGKIVELAEDHPLPFI